MHILGLIRCISWTKDAIIEYQNAGNHMVFFGMEIRNYFFDLWINISCADLILNRIWLEIRFQDNDS